MGKKKKAKNKAPSEKWTKYKLEGKKLIKGVSCPKCGPGKFLAVHKDRKTCGSCHYTEFIKK
ncbi:MAG TPA: 30S ribosomal protein S27ae [Candidatus Nanoarchaeia archaeon]|nr:30S ribosomal protein S27ae [Candidatus Nanoarchaeia archaeon]